MTSFYMEKMFHARWWDYSNKPMNLHGRIWIGNLILFGIASVIIVKFIDPYYFNYIETINPIAVNIIAWMIIILMVGDYILSHILMNIVKKEIDNSTGDNTEEISRQIHELLRNRSALQRRILQAYPDFRVLPHNFVEKYKQAKKDYQKARKEFISVLTKRFNKDFNKDLFLRAKKELEEKYQVLNQLADNFRKKF